MNYVEGLTSVEGGYGRTGSRSPMQWDSTNNAGFSSAPSQKLYIPIDPDPDRPTAEAQLSLSSLPAGEYVCRANADGFVVTRKIIKL